MFCFSEKAFQRLLTPSPAVEACDVNQQARPLAVQQDTAKASPPRPGPVRSPKLCCSTQRYPILSRGNPCQYAPNGSVINITSCHYCQRLRTDNNNQLAAASDHSSKFQTHHLLMRKPSGSRPRL